MSSAFLVPRLATFALALLQWLGGASLSLASVPPPPPPPKAPRAPSSAPKPPAPPKPPRAVVPHHGLKESAGSVSSFVLVRGDRESMRVTNSHIDELNGLQSLKARFGKDFLWFRQGRQGYVIQDAATLAKILDIYKPEEALDRQEEALDKREEKLESQQAALETRQEDVDERLEQLEEKEEELEDAAARARIASQRHSLEKERVPLDQELKNLEREIEKLSKEQEFLGHQQEEISRKVERELDRVMVEAIRTGVAVKVDHLGSVAKR